MASGQRWHALEVPLDELTQAAGSWEIVSELIPRPPTQQEFLCTIAALSGLKIRGQYVVFADFEGEPVSTAALDDVQLLGRVTTPPVVAASSVVASSPPVQSTVAMEFKNAPPGGKQVGRLTLTNSGSTPALALWDGQLASPRPGVNPSTRFRVEALEPTTGNPLDYHGVVPPAGDAARINKVGFNVTYTAPDPAEAKGDEAALSFTRVDPGARTLLYPLRGNLPKSGLHVIDPPPPSALDFGEVKVGQKLQKSVILKVTGSEAMTVSLSTLAKPFTAKPSALPLKINANGQATLPIEFAPTAQSGPPGKVLQATLTLTPKLAPVVPAIAGVLAATPTPPPPPVKITLRGTILKVGQLRVVDPPPPTKLDFGIVAAPFLEKMVTIENTTSQSLAVRVGMPRAPFSSPQGGTTIQLPPGRKGVAVRFTPPAGGAQTLGPYSGQIDFNVATGHTVETVRVDLTGDSGLLGVTVDPPAGPIFPPAKPFSWPQSPRQSSPLRVKNTGAQPIVVDWAIQQPARAGPPVAAPLFCEDRRGFPEPYPTQGSFQLGPNGTRDLVFLFNVLGEAVGSTWNATLTLTYRGIGEATPRPLPPVPLQGRVIPLNLQAPASVDFGMIGRPGSSFREVTFTNSGPPLSVSYREDGPQVGYFFVDSQEGMGNGVSRTMQIPQGGSVIRPVWVAIRSPGLPGDPPGPTRFDGGLAYSWREPDETHIRSGVVHLFGMVINTSAAAAGRR